MKVQEKDKKLIWHPFTQQFGLKDNVVIERGEGVYLIDDKGQRYIDAISSWWVNLHGHCHPAITQAIHEQLMKMEHALFSGFTHPAAVQLSEKLLNYLPSTHAKVFYSDNGSTSVEVALKMCLQYWDNKQERRSTFIAFENAYHGDTFGGMSVGARNVFNRAFETHLFDVRHIPLPTRENFAALKNYFLDLLSTGDVVGFIFEPLVQGAAGMCMYEAGLLDELVAMAQDHNVLCIADEVMTGFGRTGKMFASDHLTNKPDILCMSKGITGGYMPLGATSCTQQVYNAFVDSDKTKTFFHGHSYTAYPAACAASLASMKLLEQQETQQNIARIATDHAAFAKRIKDHPKLKEVRQLGTILAFELHSSEGTHYLNPLAEDITSFFMSKGIILRPLGNVFYILPPYVISAGQLQEIYTAIEEFLN